MKLSDMEERRTGSRVEFRAPISDEAGNRHFELTCFGPGRLVKRVLEESDFDIRIQPHAQQQDLQKELQTVWPSAHKDLATEAVDPFAKQKAVKARKPATADTVFMRLARTEGEGTVSAVYVPGIALPRLFNFFFIMPPACNCFSVVTPLAGDPDLFLTLNSIAPPIVAASTRAGAAIDAISFGAVFCFPPFIPFVRVNAFTTTVFNVSSYTFSIP